MVGHRTPKPEVGVDGLVQKGTQTSRSGIATKVLGEKTISQATFTLDGIADEM